MEVVTVAGVVVHLIVVGAVPLVIVSVEAVAILAEGELLVIGKIS